MRCFTGETIFAAVTAYTLMHCVVDTLLITAFVQKAHITEHPPSYQQDCWTWPFPAVWFSLQLNVVVAWAAVDWAGALSMPGVLSATRNTV